MPVHRTQLSLKLETSAGRYVAQSHSLARAGHLPVDANFVTDALRCERLEARRVTSVR